MNTNVAYIKSIENSVSQAASQIISWGYEIANSNDENMTDFDEAYNFYLTNGGNELTAVELWVIERQFKNEFKS